jgi:hypothetical protein
VLSVGALRVRLAGDSSFPLDPPRLACEVDVTEPSESARTVRFAAVIVAEPPMDARVRWVTFASAIPAPPVAALASPLAVAATTFVAEMDISPPACTELVPSRLAVAVLLMSAPATATSAPGVPSPGLATALIGAVTVDDAESETVPLALRSDAPLTETVAVESACKPMNFELGEGGATVDRALRRIAAPTSCAPVTVVDADPVAFTSPLRAEPVWSFAASRLIEPVPVFTTAPAATTIVSARIRKDTPGNESVPLTVMVSSPPPPSTVSEVVGTGNSTLSIVPVVDSTMTRVGSDAGRTVMWSESLLPVTVIAASGEGGGVAVALGGSIVMGSRPV